MDEPFPMHFDFRVMVYLFLSALGFAGGYAAWNIGILHGNMTFLAVVSYFTPILSSAFAAILLSVPLAVSFWQGVAMVCFGSVVCWISIKKKV